MPAIWEPLALDFGTSTTVLARRGAQGEPEVLDTGHLASPPSAGGWRLVPSLAYAQAPDAGEWVVGEAVRAQGLDQPAEPRFRRAFKRAIALAAPEHAPEVDGVALSAECVGEAYLGALLKAARAQGWGGRELIMSVPVAAYEAYLAWLNRVLPRLGVARWQAVDEPTAAALGESLHRPGAVVAVVDVGAGTTDMAVVRLAEAQAWAPEGAGRPALVLAKVGLELGGEALDAAMAEEALVAEGLSLADLGPEASAWLRACEAAKVRLSTEAVAEVAMFWAGGGRVLSAQVTREAFEAALERRGHMHRVARSLAALERQAEGQGVPLDAVEAVLVVGGGAAMPWLRRLVAQAFGPDKLVAVAAPQAAVALGALLASGGALGDLLFHGYGLRYWDPRQQRHAYAPLLAPGTRYPTEAPIERILRASKPKQPAIELLVAELAFPAERLREVVFAGERLELLGPGAALGEPERAVLLNAHPEARALAKLDPPGEPGVDRVRALFRVDEARRLRVHISDLHSGLTLVDDQVLAELR